MTGDKQSIEPGTQIDRQGEHYGKLSILVNDLIPTVIARLSDCAAMYPAFSQEAQSLLRERMAAIIERRAFDYRDPALVAELVERYSKRAAELARALSLPNASFAVEGESSPGTGYAVLIGGGLHCVCD